MTKAQEEWARCRAWIEGALEFTAGLYDIEDIEKAISEGRMIFIPGVHCAVVVEVCIYPNGKALNVFAGGGERGSCIDEYMERMDPCVVALAKSFDCRWVTHFTRASGERLGKRLGYRKQWSVLMKDV